MWKVVSTFERFMYFMDKLGTVQIEIVIHPVPDFRHLVRSIIRYMSGKSITAVLAIL